MGRILGSNDTGCAKGFSDGRLIDAGNGCPIGVRVGMLVGKEGVGIIDGEAVSSVLGFKVGAIVSWRVGRSVGCQVGY